MDEILQVGGGLLDQNAGLANRTAALEYRAGQHAAVRSAPSAPSIDAGRCVFCAACVTACPTGAITTDESQGMYTIDLARCMFCGRCADKSREGAIWMSPEFELSARLSQDLLVRCKRDAQGRVAESTPDPTDTTTVADRVNRRIHETLGNSLHLRHLDSGSCNACDWELTTLLAPHYDVRRLAEFGETEVQ